MQKKSVFFRRGFTITELAIVMGISAILLSLATVNLSVLIPKGNVTTSTDILLTDIKQQQAKAMLGETQGQSTTNSYGIFLENNQYTLFAGSAFNATSSANMVVSVPASLEIVTNLPISTLLFTKGSGEVQGFVQGSNTVTLRDRSFSTQRVLSVNQYGVITGLTP